MPTIDEPLSAVEVDALWDRYYNDPNPDHQPTSEEIMRLFETEGRLRAENDRLREQVAGLTAALIPFLRYGDELLWADRDVWDDDVVLRWPSFGPPRVIVRRRDFKALRAAIPIPNPGLSVSPVVPNPGLSVSPAPPTEGGESS
jgi:hypothetical protein